MISQRRAHDVSLYARQKIRIVKPKNCKEKKMQTKITIRNEAHTCYIDIEGTIGVPEQHQFENASTRIATFDKFREEVARIAEIAATKVVVNIRSTGGDVNDALLIYDALMGLDAHITTRCFGYTASAATIIAQAANDGCREISSNAMYLIHKSTCSIEGNASSLDARADLLRKTDERLASLYALHSGRDAQYFADLMAENNGEGRWLTAEETVEAGLADRITDPLITGALVPEQVEEEPIPSNVAIPEVVNSAAGEIIRYLLGRLAYRIEEWLERLHEKHQEKREAKREQKRAERDAKRSEQAEATEESALPQAVVHNTSPSRIAFEEQQQRFTATPIKAAEDPSMNQPMLGSNEQAYADDAKAFGRY